MEIKEIRQTPLEQWGLRNLAQAKHNLVSVASYLPRDLFGVFVKRLENLLPLTPDPDMALNNFERLLHQPTVREQFPLLLAADEPRLDYLLQIVSMSQFFADVLVLNPDLVSLVWSLPRHHPSSSELQSELSAEIQSAADDAGLLRAFRRFRQRHLLRIGINDVLRERPLEEVTRELSRLAEVILSIALKHAQRTLVQRFGHPTVAGRSARLAVLAFGKLGGEELNYSSDIDLMVVYDGEGETSGRRSAISNGEFFARVVREVVRLLSSVTDRGFAYRVDLRLRPEGSRGPLARSVASTLSYYDTMGRTWERQALIKLRPVAGDLELGWEFIRAIEPFIYRKYFSFAEINEVKALKRRMEQLAARSGNDDQDVKTGRGGIRDIEYTVQFLQLLNGGDLPTIRQRNTLLALEALEIAGCLNSQETYILADAYRFLRKTEHRLQLLFDLQTHRLPNSADELRRLARRMGYIESRLYAPSAPQSLPEPNRTTALSQGEQNLSRAELTAQRRSPLDEAAPITPANDQLLVDPLDQFLKDLHDKTALDRTILNHLLHQTFPTDGDAAAEPESDLILDPDPDENAIRAVLGRYPFRDVNRAYQNLSLLARESVPFLSARRCRHFLASIAPALLRAVAQTPDPDEALTNLERVSASLGAKAVLWELFSVSPPSLHLYVDLCAGSPFLSGLLINNPGMIDELLDSLVLNQPRTLSELQRELSELCRGAQDPDPILHSFQDKELLRVAVGDLLGKTSIAETTAALSDLAETVLNQVFDLCESKVSLRSDKLGNAPAIGKLPCAYVVLGLGKLGGRELDYHSDLDLLLLYEKDGEYTVNGSTFGSINQFFTELAQRAIRMLSQMGPMGRLYPVDMRLRPTGKSGSLVLSLAEFCRYFSSSAQLWERQALLRARVVRGEGPFVDKVIRSIPEAIFSEGWSPIFMDEIHAMRLRLESPSPRHLKRGIGGIMDIEFLVQMLQMKYGRRFRDLLQTNIWVILKHLAKHELLTVEEEALLEDSYSFLRRVMSRLRVATDRPCTELPESAEDLTKFARRLGYSPCLDYSAAQAFENDLRRITTQVRHLYMDLFRRERNS